ncbi:MAG TPA: hypothetical protein VFB27_02105 [Opitutaceae bacterium]|nr:hypothetical protein [Opitutaceae bacterium]
MEHNSGFHCLDERMRFYVQAVAENSVGEAAFADATLRGLLKPEAPGLLKKILVSMRPALADGQLGVCSSVQAGDVEKFSERLARGLHFWHYKTFLKGKISLANTHIVHPNVDVRPAIVALEEMVPNLKTGDITNDQVFRYWYGKTVESNGEGFLLKAVFYESVGFYVMSVEVDEHPI